MRSNRRSVQRTHGFTLIEIVVTVVLLGILIAVASEPLLQGTKARMQVTSDLEALGKLRYATERIVRELRQVKFLSGGTGFQLAAINGSGSSSTGVCFTRVGGTLGTTDTIVSIKLTGSNVTLENPASCASLGSSPPTLAENVSTLTFDFYGDGITSTPDSISTSDTDFGNLVNFVDVTLSITQGGVTLSQKTRVLLRNGSWA